MKQPKTALMSCGCRFSGRRGFYRKCAFHELTARAFWSQVPDEERPPGLDDAKLAPEGQGGSTPIGPSPVSTGVARSARACIAL